MKAFHPFFAPFHHHVPSILCTFSLICRGNVIRIFHVFSTLQRSCWLLTLRFLFLNVDCTNFEHFFPVNESYTIQFYKIMVIKLDAVEMIACQASIAHNRCSGAALYHDGKPCEVFSVFETYQSSK